MDTLIAVAASGMRSRLESLDILANNLANANTSGYKADHEAYQLYFGAGATEDWGDNQPAPSSMPALGRDWIDMSQGTLIDTGNMSDVALSGPGFFAVQTTTGTLYTRTGSFRVSKQRQLTTPEGFPVLGVGGQPITLDPAQPWTVSPNGAVMQGGAVAGTLEVVTTSSPGALVKHGGTYFALEPGNTMSVVADPSLLQGKVEGSNVPAPQAAVKLVGVMRQFEMLQKAVRMAGDMDKQAIEQVARVSS
ncbi:MAG TPA: flagellar hook-basal body protein [Bryobacteraceae bacterium]|jgi:flagellar basal body rod protein FlgG|nr:flagellar hook-basal body protein [Bryobacteraceae bacterium]